MGVALIGVALLLAACAPTPAHDATVVSRLDDMLLDESAVNAIMGPPPLTATHTYRALEQWPAGYSYSPADCLAVSGNAMVSVYQGTRSGEIRGTLFTNDKTGTEVDEAVVAFDTAAHARDFVASTAGTWQRCSDEVLTITSAGRSPRPVSSSRGLAMRSRARFSLWVHPSHPSHPSHPLPTPPRPASHPPALREVPVDVPSRARHRPRHHRA